MRTALLVVGVAFLAVAAATAATGNDVVWSTFLALGVVCLAAAFALDRDTDSTSDDPEFASTATDDDT